MKKLFNITPAHSQTTVSVNVTYKEKEEIRKAAGKKGMSRYLLDLHNLNRKGLCKVCGKNPANFDGECYDCCH